MTKLQLLHTCICASVKQPQHYLNSIVPNWCLRAYRYMIANSQLPLLYLGYTQS